MCRLLVAKGPLGDRGLLRGFVIVSVEDDHVFSDSDLELHWVVDIPGKTKASGDELIQPLTRAAVPGEDAFEAPDAEDRIVKLGVRKYYFAFDETQLQTLNTYGGIALLPGDAEATIKQTQSGGLFKFGS